MRTASLENFQKSATQDMEQLKESLTQNEQKCAEQQTVSCETKLKKIKDQLEEEKEIHKKLQELTTKDLYLEAYSRRENIKFNRIPETRGEDTEEVLRAFLQNESGYVDASTVEIQRVHRLGSTRERKKRRATTNLGSIPPLERRREDPFTGCPPERHKFSDVSRPTARTCGQEKSSNEKPSPPQKPWNCCIFQSVKTGSTIY